MATNSLAGVNLAQIAQKSLAALLPRLNPLKAFTTDFSSDIGVAGGTVTTRVPTALTTGALTTGYSANAQNATLGARTITLGAVKGLVVGFNDEEWSKSSINLQNVFIRPGVNAISKGMIDDALALVTAANYGSAAFTGAASTLDADDVADLAATLTAANVLPDERFMILGPTYFAALAKDTAIQQAYAYGSPEAIRENKVPMVHGFKIVEYSAIPGNSENLIGLLGAPEGIIIAARSPAVPEGFNGQIENVTDPESGFTFQLRKWYSMDDGQHYLSMAAISGVAVGVAGNLKRMVSA